jgi:hypothetical protein
MAEQTSRFFGLNRYLFISLLSGLLGFVAKLIYRPFIVSNQINDFEFHAFAPNLFYTLCLNFCIAFVVKKQKIKAMMYGTTGVLVYEFEQVWTSRTFDYLDIAATIGAFGIALLVVKKYKC